MRILPYRTSDDRIIGLVLTFVDIDASKRTQQENLTFMEAIVATVREPLLVLDSKLRVRFANASFFTGFLVPENETLGQVVFDLGKEQWDIPELRHLLQEITTRDVSFENFEVSGDFPGLGRKRMLLNARRVATDADQPPLILLAIEDATD